MDLTDAEKVRWIVGAFGAVYGFILTLWAVCLPTLRQTGSGKWGFVWALIATIVGYIAYMSDLVPSLDDAASPITVSELFRMISVFVVVVILPLQLWFLSTKSNGD